jgi:hypothetical protein
MKKNIKLFSILLLTTLMMSTSYSIEKNISFYVGHSNGGGSAALQTIVSQELVKKGWNVDFKVIGNCGSVKDLLETSDKPILAGWSPDWNSNKDNVCFNPPTKDNFIKTFMISPRLLCGPYDDFNFKIVKGNTYRIGVNQGQNHDVLLNDLGKRLGVTFKVIEYKNSGFIKRAMQAKEIDAWYTTAGLPQHENKTQKCVYGTIDNTYLGIKPLKSILPTDNVYTSFVGFLLVNKNVTGDLKVELKKDILSIVTSKQYRENLKSAGFGDFITDASDNEQIRLIEATAKAFKK